MNDDPIEAAGPCWCGDPLCSCTRCHGVGWVQVAPTYAEQVVPSLTLEQAAVVQQSGPEAAAAVDRQLQLQRAAAGQSYYPCKSCNASLFFRWRDGHYGGENHNRATCTGCQDEPTRRRRRTHA